MRNLYRFQWSRNSIGWLYTMIGNLNWDGTPGAKKKEKGLTANGDAWSFLHWKQMHWGATRSVAMKFSILTDSKATSKFHNMCYSKYFTYWNFRTCIWKSTLQLFRTVCALWWHSLNKYRYSRYYKLNVHVQSGATREILYEQIQLCFYN
jgi:hypothetical protein